MPNCYLGYDCGTMGTKVAVYADDSTLMAEAYRPHEITHPRPGWAEMEPDQFYRVVSEGIRECMHKSGIAPRDIKGISCSGVICGFLPVDDQWHEVGPYIPFLDGRAKEEAREVSGLNEQPWIEESGNMDIGAYMPPMFMKWQLKHEKERMKAAKKVVTAAQYVMGRLGGMSAKDAFIDWAHLSGWVIGYDARKRDWSEKQMQLLDIPYEYLPQVKKPWDVVGTLCRSEAEKLGLREGIPLVAGAGDIMQSNLGSGVIDHGMCSDVAGTASIFTFVVPDYKREVTEKKVILNAMPTLLDQFMYWSFIPAGGFSLRWFRDQVMQRKNDEAFFEEMNGLAAQVPIGAEFSLFFPFLQGRSAPAWPEASAAWIGLYGSSNTGTLWRSMLESIAFEYFTYVEILESVGIGLKQVVGTGGGSKGRFWNQIKADILDAPYTTLKRTEGAVMGNALLAAHGVGDFKNLRGKIREWIEQKETFEPIDRNTRVYREIFKARQDILNGPMREVFRRLAGMHENIRLPE